MTSSKMLRNLFSCAVLFSLMIVVLGEENSGNNTTTVANGAQDMSAMLFTILTFFISHYILNI